MISGKKSIFCGGSRRFIFVWPIYDGLWHRPQKLWRNICTAPYCTLYSIVLFHALESHTTCFTYSKLVARTDPREAPWTSTSNLGPGSYCKLGWSGLFGWVKRNGHRAGYANPAEVSPQRSRPSGYPRSSSILNLQTFVLPTHPPPCSWCPAATAHMA